MAVGKVRKPSPEMTMNACVGGIMLGQSQRVILDNLGISKPTLKIHLDKLDTSWKKLSDEYARKKYVNIKEKILPNKSKESKVSRQKPKVQSKTKKRSTSPSPLIIYEEGSENGTKSPSGKEGKYDGIEINEQFIERVIRSTVEIAELQEDSGILLKAGALAFSLLKEKKALALGTGEEHEYSAKELKEILGDEEF